MRDGGRRSSRDWPLLAAVAMREERFLRWSEPRMPLAPAFYEFVRFGMKQAPSRRAMHGNCA